MPVPAVKRIALLLLLIVAGCHSTRGGAPAATPEQRQQNLDSFDQVWTTIRDKHWDPALGGLDWNAVNVELRPKVEQARTTPEARAVMQDMVGRLNQSHFAIIPGGLYRDGESQATGRGETGIDVRVRHDKAIVVAVADDSPAARAGVCPGWIVEKIDGKSLAPLFNEIREEMKKDKLLPVMLMGSAKARLRGDVGQTVDVQFRDGDGRVVRKSLLFAEPAGRAANFGNLPTMYVTFESRWIEPKVGYIAFSKFFDPATVMGRFEEAMETFARADGVILDLRGNPGGIGAMAMGVGGYFVSAPDQKLGTMKMRQATINFILNPRADVYEGPLAVLVDEASMSTSEILAGGLQDLKRARVFGVPTPGAALPSTVERLPNGDGFQYAFATYTSTGGQPLEGRGVVPDEVVDLDRKVLLAGRDPVIDAAVRWIESQKKRLALRVY